MEAERRYRDFDWSRCVEWQSYLSNIFPSPTLAQVQRIRRRWYQRHIDSTLSIDQPPESPQPAASLVTQKALVHLEVGLFLLAFGFSHKILHVIATGFFADIVRKQGPPKLSREYWTSAARDSELTSVLYCLLFLTFQKELLAVLPATLSSAALSIDLCCTNPAVTQLLKTAGQKLEAWKPWLLTWQYRLELLLIPVLLLTSQPSLSLLLLVILYCYLLAYRYSLKPTTKEAILELQVCGDAACRRWPRLKAPWRRAKQLCSLPTCTVM